MPENGSKSHLVNNGKTVQSVWLSHWIRTKSETIEHDPLSHLNRSKEDELTDHDFKKHPTAIEISSDNFRCSKDVNFSMSLKKSSTQSFQFFKRGQENVKCSQSKLTGGLTVDTSSSEYHLQPPDQIKHHMFFSESSYLKQLPDSEKSEMPSFSALLKSYPISNYRSLAFIEEQYKKMEKTIGMGCFPLNKSQNNIHDVEMKKMIGGFNGFSRTTHGLLLMKQTDVRVYQESRFFGQLQEEALRELKCNQQCVDHGQQGVKLQLLDSSDPESMENVQKNESSADTEAMDMESFMDNQLSGIHLFPTNKDIMVDSNVENNNCRKRKIEQSDINSETSDQPNASNSDDKTKPCMSRTQSLDMSNLNQPTNSNSNQCSNSNACSESGSRWIKRLKLNETSSPQKMNRFFTTVTEGKQEHESDKLLDKKLETDESEIQMDESSAVETTTRVCDDISLSHSWIQRWSHKHKHKQNENNHETREVCQLDILELETDEFQKKQFPSIGAMALMGKAITGIPQCKLERKESFVVWDTKVSISKVVGGITSSVLF